MTTEQESVGLERHGRVAVVTLNTPRRLNAIGRSTLGMLDGIVDAIARDGTIGAVLFRGVGRAFSAGADIAEISTFTSPGEFAAFLEQMTGVYDRVECLPQPTIAAIHGAAFGGGLELALACDLRMMSDEAQLGFPEIRLGLLPGGGGTQRLLRLVPAAVVNQLLMTGEPIGTADALRFGLVNEVHPADGLSEAALAVAESIAQGSAAALAAAKRLVRYGGEQPLSGAIAFEREVVTSLFASADGAEGVRAFLEKRPPVFHLPQEPA